MTVQTIDNQLDVLGKILSVKRELLGYNQQKMTELLKDKGFEISQKSYSNIETGNVKTPELALIAAIGDILEINDLVYQYFPILKEICNKYILIQNYNGNSNGHLADESKLNNDNKTLTDSLNLPSNKNEEGDMNYAMLSSLIQANRDQSAAFKDVARANIILAELLQSRYGDDELKKASGT